MLCMIRKYQKLIPQIRKSSAIVKPPHQFHPLLYPVLITQGHRLPNFGSDLSLIHRPTQNLSPPANNQSRSSQTSPTHSAQKAAAPSHSPPPTHPHSGSFDSLSS